MSELALIVMVAGIIVAALGWLTFAGISIDAAQVGGHNRFWAFLVTIIWGPLATIVYCLRPTQDEVEGTTRGERD